MTQINTIDINPNYVILRTSYDDRVNNIKKKEWSNVINEYKTLIDEDLLTEWEDKNGSTAEMNHITFLKLLGVISVDNEIINENKEHNIVTEFLKTLYKPGICLKIKNGLINQIGDYSMIFNKLSYCWGGIDNNFGAISCMKYIKLTNNEKNINILEINFDAESG